MTSKQLKYIDIFAGCGGISLGLHQANLRGLFAVEKNSDAFQTLKFNLIDNKSHFDWPHWLDVKAWNINQILSTKQTELQNLQGRVDLVVGGPPCQGFSMAGQRQVEDERNELIHAYLRFIELVKPRVILFENVKGFTVKFKDSENLRAYSQIILNKLHSLGYSDAVGKIINMYEYGLPQKRQRFVLVATLENKALKIFNALEENKEGFLNERGLKLANNVHDALSDLQFKNGTTQCPDSKRFLSGISPASQNNYQTYLREKSEGSYVPDSHRFVNHTKPVREVFELLLKDAPRSKMITGEERDRYGIKKRNVAVLSPEEPSLTITTIPDDFVHYSEPRIMTVRECARLQSFPDWYEFKGTYTTGGKRRKQQTPRYTQVGNAVPPLFAEQLGIAIKKVLLNG